MGQALYWSLGIVANKLDLAPALMDFWFNEMLLDIAV